MKQAFHIAHPIARNHNLNNKEMQTTFWVLIVTCIRQMQVITYNGTTKSLQKTLSIFEKNIKICAHTFSMILKHLLLYQETCSQLNKILTFTMKTIRNHSEIISLISLKFGIIRKFKNMMGLNITHECISCTQTCSSLPKLLESRKS